MERVLKTACILAVVFFGAVAVRSVSYEEAYGYSPKPVEKQLPVSVSLSYYNGLDHGILRATMTTSRATVTIPRLLTSGVVSGSGTIPANDANCDKSWTLEGDFRAYVAPRRWYPDGTPVVIDAKGVRFTIAWSSKSGTKSFDTVYNGKTYGCTLYWDVISCTEKDAWGRIQLQLGCTGYLK